MKEITKERTEYYTMYQAVDGTEFKEKEECQKYDDSALGVIRGKLKKLTVGKYNCWDLMRGYEDNNCIAVKIETEKDKDVVLQAYYLDQPWILRDENANKRKAFEESVDRALAEHDIFFFGFNCDDELYIIGNRNDIVQRLIDIDKV